MQNYVHPGAVVPLTAPSGGVVSGRGVKIGAIIAIAASTKAAGESFEGALEGVFDVASDTGAAWAEGDKVYWNDTDKVFTKTANGNTLAGLVVAAKVSGGTTGRVNLRPQF